MEKVRKDLVVKAPQFFQLPPGVIRVNPSRLSPGDLIFIASPSTADWVECKLTRLEPPWFEVSNKLCPEPYRIRLTKSVWALKVTPWMTPKPPRKPGESFRPGKVLHREFSPDPTDNFSNFWTWDYNDPRARQEYYATEEREWRDLNSRFWGPNFKNKRPQPEPKPRNTHQEWYDLLEVRAGVTLKDLKKAYRKSAFKYHPDRCKDKDAEDMFKKVSFAYENLVKLFSQKR